MAHGFLSTTPQEGKSGIEKFLDKKFDEQTKKLGGLLKNRLKQYAIDALFNLRTKSPRSPKPYSWSKGDSTPLQNMLRGSALQRALPGTSDAINPDGIYGGEPTVRTRNPFVNFSNNLSPDIDASNAIFDTTAQKVVDGDGGIFAKSASVTGGGGSGEIVAAIERLTNVTRDLVAATDDQTANQSRIASNQKIQSDKLAKKALIGAETSGFTNDDFSSNIAYEGLAQAGLGMMGRGRGGGGGLGLGLGALGTGIGGKVAARKMAMAVAKRGSARAGRRLGIALGGKLSYGLGRKLGKRLAGKSIGKIAGKGLAKSLGKKVPLLGLGLGAIFAAQRAMQGDFLGAGLELASGAASTVPGIGTAASVGLDAALMAKDVASMRTGGEISGFSDNSILAVNGNPVARFNETNNEETLKIEKDGDDKYIKMGEGILDAQRRNKQKFGKVQAEGLKEYYDKQGGWGRMGAAFSTTLTLNTNVFEGFGKTLKDILGAIKLPWGDKLFDFGNNNNGDNTGTNTDLKQHGDKNWIGGKRFSGQQKEVNADGVFTSQIGGVVTKIGEDKKLGQYVDIVNEEKGVTERIADISGVVSGIEVGSVVAAGDPVAKGNDAGIIHYEIREGGDTDPSKYEAQFGFGGSLNPEEFLQNSNIDSSTESNGDMTGVETGVEETTSTVLNTLSEDVATTSGGTTIINNITNNNMTNGSSSGNDVTLGSTSSEMGVDGFIAQLRWRAA